MNRELEVAKAIAHEAGEVMRTYFYGDQQRTIKQDGTPLTIADTTINTLVIKRLHEAFPDDGVIGEEESTTEYGMGRKWFCDPIDGTKGFTWGVPTAMFSLGFVIDGKPQVGVAYEPITDRLYWAVRGGGAFCNNQPIHVNDQTLEEGIVVTISDHKRIRHGAPYLDELINRGITMAAFSGAVSKIVRVAEGRFVGYVEEYLTAYDLAAAHVVVEEAGGRITTLDGEQIDYSRPLRGAVVANQQTHQELVDILARAKA
jgi:myo-inositol-1(or 4)-monophosphatase